MIIYINGVMYDSNVIPLALFLTQEEADMIKGAEEFNMLTYPESMTLADASKEVFEGTKPLDDQVKLPIICDECSDVLGFQNVSKTDKPVTHIVATCPFKDSKNTCKLLEAKQDLDDSGFIKIGED